MMLNCAVADRFPRKFQLLEFPRREHNVYQVEGFIQNVQNNNIPDNKTTTEKLNKTRERERQTDRQTDRQRQTGRQRELKLKNFNTQVHLDLPANLAMPGYKHRQARLYYKHIIISTNKQ